MKKESDFSLSRKERGFLISFIIFIFLLVIVWRVLPLMIKSNEEEGKEMAEAWQHFKENNLIIEEDKKDRKAYSNATETKTESKPAKLFPFNPNTVTESELILLGLPERTAKTWVKYRSKGGKFYKKEDIKKLYTLSAEDYNRIVAYAVIPDASIRYEQKESKSSFKEEIPKIIDINTADAATFMSLRGIGPAYSRRIIEFRTALGGFLSIEQIAEVYQFPDSTFQKLKPQFSLQSEFKIQKINVNTATEEELAKHPYIRKFLAKNIVLLRSDLKRFNNIEQLRQVPLINEEKYRKIVPYLKLE